MRRRSSGAISTSRPWSFTSGRKQVRGVVGPISRKKPAPKELPMMPELAETLEAIADEGPDVFYSGRVGRAIVKNSSFLSRCLRSWSATYQRFRSGIH